jgi:site-specific recombinase
MAWAAVTKPQLGQMLSMQGQMILFLLWIGMTCRRTMSSSSAMHHTIPSGAFSLSQMTYQWVVIATMGV